MEVYSVATFVVCLALVQAANSTILMCKSDMPMLSSQALGCGVFVLLGIGIPLSLISVIAAFFEFAWYMALLWIFLASFLWNGLYQYARGVALAPRIFSAPNVSRQDALELRAELWDRYASLPRKAFFQLIFGIALLLLWNDAAWMNYLNLF